MPGDSVTFISTSGGTHEVMVSGRTIGTVGKVGRVWTGRVGEFEIGEHRTRREAVEALIDVDRQ